MNAKTLVMYISIKKPDQNSFINTHYEQLYQSLTINFISMKANMKSPLGIRIVFIYSKYMFDIHIEPNELEIHK